MKKTKLLSITALVLVMLITLVACGGNSGSSGTGGSGGGGGGGSNNPTTPIYTIPTGLTATFGQTLSQVTLPTGWAWVNPDAQVGQAGNRNHNATFTPTSNRYYPVTRIVTISVREAFNGVFVGELEYRNIFSGNNYFYTFTYEFRADLTMTRQVVRSGQVLPTTTGIWERDNNRFRMTPNNDARNIRDIAVLHEGRLYVRRNLNIVGVNITQQLNILERELDEYSHFVLTRQGG
ncbi:MAG: hypothetical protein FWC80_06080 [Firmicutes bacterium]|nr:hypothetical protein [Bacillota bacterium]